LTWTLRSCESQPLYWCSELGPRPLAARPISARTCPCPARSCYLLCADNKCVCIVQAALPEREGADAKDGTDWRPDMSALPPFGDEEREYLVPDD
jgi:hypothetical protein